MKYLLTASGRLALMEWMRGAPLLGFDFDGTLAPIVDTPMLATLRPRTRELLQALAARYSCVVLSGRARQDVQRRLADIPLREVFGNHGLEPWHISASLLRQVRQWHQILSERLRGWPGVWIEDKDYSLSIHYRHSADPERTRKEALPILALLRGARIISGKLVFNVMPTRVVHKGTAFTEAMRRFRRARALYVGDDHTDEDIFTSCDPAQVLGVHVGPSRTSRALYYLRRQEEMDELLELLTKS